MLLTTGFNGAVLTRYTDIVSISKDLTLTICNQVDYWHSKHAIYFASGGLIKTGDGTVTPIVCGGAQAPLDPVPSAFNSKKCNVLGGCRYIDVLQKRSSGSATTVLNKGEILWVTGGIWDELSIHNGETSATMTPCRETNLITSTGSDFNIGNGIPLPQARAFHCLVTLEDNVVVLCGGGDSYHSVSDQCWTLDYILEEEDSNDWTLMAPLLQARSYHQCKVLVMNGGAGKMIVAAGGIDANNQTTDTVEVLYLPTGGQDDLLLTSQNWTTGPRMPMALAGAVSATTGNQSVLLVVGGVPVWGENGIVSKTILMLSCDSNAGHDLVDNCQWTINDLKLPIGRAFSTGLLLPSHSIFTGK